MYLISFLILDRDLSLIQFLIKKHVSVEQHVMHNRGWVGLYNDFGQVLGKNLTKVLGKDLTQVLRNVLTQVLAKIITQVLGNVLTQVLET